MTKHIEPCLLCGPGSDMYAIEESDRFGIEKHSIFCSWCKTCFSNENYEESEEETIEWFNNLPRKE